LIVSLDFGRPLFLLFGLTALSYPEVVGEDERARQDAQAIEMDAFRPYRIRWEEKGGGAHVAKIGPPTELLKVPLGGLLDL
jgi:hypothetical protein